MIERREFGKALVGGMVSTSSVVDVAIAAQGELTARPAKNLLMHVGADYHCVACGDRMRECRSLPYSRSRRLPEVSASAKRDQQALTHSLFANLE